MLKQQDGKRALIKAIIGEIRGGGRRGGGVIITQAGGVLKEVAACLVEKKEGKNMTPTFFGGGFTLLDV